MIQVWVTGGRVITAAMNQKFDEARDAFLGPRNKLTCSRPTKPTNANGNRTRGAPKGGIAYERTKVCKSVQEPSCCYTMGPSGEALTSIVAPVASAKMSSEEVDADAALRRDLLNAGAAIAAAAFTEALAIVHEQTAELALLINLPCIGVHNNYAYATCQTNLTSAKRPVKRNQKGKKGRKDYGYTNHCIAIDPGNMNAYLGPSLSGNMGFFGGAHFDMKDHPGHFSHMSANSDLPADDEVPEGQEYTPGFFFIPELGVFIVLDRHTSINFSGLRRHGGTPPLCSPNTFNGKPAKLYKFAYRFVLIFYPPTRMMDGTARLTLGALPHNEAFILPPEMLHAGVTNRIKKGWPAEATCDHASFFREGVLMMCQRALFTFIVRALLLICFYFVLQLPSAYCVRVDPDIFLTAFTMRFEGRHTVDCDDDNMIDQDTVVADLLSIASQRNRIPTKPEKETKGKHPAVPVDGYEGGNESKPIVEVETEDGEPETGVEDAPSPPARGKVRPRRGPRAPAIIASSAGTHACTCGSCISTRLYWNPGGHFRNMANGGDRTAHQVQQLSASLHRSIADYRSQVRFYASNPRHQHAWASDSYAKAAAGVVPVACHASSPTPARRRSSRFAAKVVETREDPSWNGAALESSDEGEAMEVDGVPDGRLPVSHPFVSMLSLASIQQNLDDIQRLWDAVSTVHGTPNLQALDTAYTALMQFPDATTTAPQFEAIWTGLDQMNSLHVMNSLRTRLDRECIMLTNFFAWRWGLHGTWIARLAVDVTTVLKQCSTSHTFISSDYDLEIDAPAFSYSNKHHHLYIDNNELLAGVVALTTRIIAAWLKFPTAGISRYQAWFVYALIRTVGRGVLLLDEAWRAYGQLRKSVLGNSIARAHCNNQFAILCAALQTHPLADQSSGETRTLLQVMSLICAIRTPQQSAPLALMDVDDRLVGTPLAEHSREPSPISPIIPSPLVRFQPPRSTHPSVRASTSPAGPLLPARPPPRSHHPSLMPSPLPTNLAPNVLRKLKRFKCFIDEALAVALPGMPVPRPTTWQTAMQVNMDRLCPFPGLNTLMFRAVTFGTEFMRTSRLCYSDEPDFVLGMSEARQHYRREHGEDPPVGFFCDTRAYGPHNHGRTVELAATYTPVVRDNNLSTQLAAVQQQGESSLNFGDCWKWLSGSIHGRVRFFHLGPLGSYLLAADYTYTSPPLVDPPTFEELGRIICTLNKANALRIGENILLWMWTLSIPIDMVPINTELLCRRCIAAVQGLAKPVTVT
ncbi:hypothetical protein C8R43DRAFT_1116175 [Mycena crocata]|nr:hypothetical protein C8R43DRAFT_1116175 [Mycena crocata]